MSNLILFIVSALYGMWTINILRILRIILFKKDERPTDMAYDSLAIWCIVHIMFAMLLALLLTFVSKV